MGTTARALETAEADSAAPLLADPEPRLEGLVRHHFVFVWRSLRRLGLVEADADDAAQRVFMVLSQQLAKVAPGRERAYLFGTAVRVAANVRRKHERSIEQPSELLDQCDNESPSPERLLERRRARALLDQLLEELRPEQRLVFILAEIEEFGQKEIAETLCIPEGTVASRLRRARAHLERKLDALRLLQEKGDEP